MLKKIKLSLVLKNLNSYYGSIRRQDMKEKIIYRYDQPFKDLVISLLESGEIKSIEEARRRFLIGGHGTIQKWLRKAGKEHLLPIIGVRTMQLEMTRLKEWDDTGTYEMVKEYKEKTGLVLD